MKYIFSKLDHLCVGLAYSRSTLYIYFVFFSLSIGNNIMIRREGKPDAKKLGLAFEDRVRHDHK